MLKVMSKMGISTYQSYCGAQIFDAVGLSTALRRQVLHRHRHHDRGRRPARGRRGGGAPPPRRLWRQPDLRARCSTSAATYACRLRGEDHAWTPETVAKLQHAVRGNLPDEYEAFAADINEQSERLLTLRGLMEFKPAETPIAAGRGRAGRRDRQALRHRRDELRLDQPRGAHHAGRRHEPHRRQLEHRRGRRGVRPLRAAAERRFHALGDQAGRLGPLRRDRRVPGQRRRHPDQDGPGRQARRGRPAARPQGRQEHRPRAPLDAGRRPDLAAAAPRHLFDRGPGAAHPRPEERQPAAPASRSSWSPKSASARSPRASPRRAPTT